MSEKSGKDPNLLKDVPLGYVERAKLIGFPEAEKQAKILGQRRELRSELTGETVTPEIGGRYAEFTDETGKIHKVVITGRINPETKKVDPNQTIVGKYLKDD